MLLTDQHAAPATPGHSRPHEGVLRLPTASSSGVGARLPQMASHFSFDADDQGEQRGSNEYATRRRAAEESASMESILYGRVNDGGGQRCPWSPPRTNHPEADWPDRAKTAPSRAAGSTARPGLSPPRLGRQEWQPSQPPQWQPQQQQQQQPQQQPQWQQQQPQQQQPQQQLEQQQQEQVEQLEQEQEDLWQQQQEQQWVLDQKRRRMQQQHQQHQHQQQQHHHHHQPQQHHPQQHQQQQHASPERRRPRRQAEDLLTTRSSSSQAAGKASRRGELSFGLGGRAWVAPCQAPTDSAQVSAVLHDVTASLRPLDEPSDEPPQPRCCYPSEVVEAVETVQESKVPPTMQRYEQVRRHPSYESTPYAGAGSTRCSRECTNPLVDPASYFLRGTPMTTTSRAAFTPAHAAPPPQQQQPPQQLSQQPQPPPLSAGETTRTSFGHAFVHPGGRTFVRAGQMAEAAGAVSQSSHTFAGAHASAPFGVTPVDTHSGRMSYRTSAEAGHGDPMSWNDAPPASLAGRIAQRRLRSRQGEGVASALSITD